MRIIAHDASTKKHLGYAKIGKVIIGNNVYIGASTTVLPGVRIGDNAIIGAGSVVTKDIPANMVYAGNPAKPLYRLDEYLDKEKENMNKMPVFEEKYTVRAGVTNELKEQMQRELENTKGYIV